MQKLKQKKNKKKNEKEEKVYRFSTGIFMLFDSVWQKLDREWEVWRRNAIFGFIVHQIGTFIKVRKWEKKIECHWRIFLSFFISNMQFHCAVFMNEIFFFLSFLLSVFHSNNTYFLQNHTPSNQQPFTIQFYDISVLFIISVKVFPFIQWKFIKK